MKFLDAFFPGEEVQSPGQYWVLHLNHKLPYRALIGKQQRFPSCPHCDVLFEFISDGMHGGVSITSDEDLFPKKSFLKPY